MSACERYEAEISALLDGELDEATAVDVRAHLETCADCRARYAAFSALHRDAVEPPDGLDARIMGAIRAETGGTAAPISKAKKRLWAPLAAAACLALVLGAVALQPMGGSGAPADNDAGASEAQTESAEATPELRDYADGAQLAEADAAEDQLFADGACATGAAVAPESAPLTLAAPEDVAAVRAILQNSVPDDAPPPEGPPLLYLETSDAQGTRTTAIYLDGDDVLYTDNGATLYRCENAADALISLLAER